MNRHPDSIARAIEVLNRQKSGEVLAPEAKPAPKPAKSASKGKSKRKAG